VPKEERVCLVQGENEMERYGGGMGLSDIDDKANLILLPLWKDIHYSFDARWFVIVPKMVGYHGFLSLPASPQYVTHITYLTVSGGIMAYISYHSSLSPIHPRSQAYLPLRPFRLG